MGYKLGFLAGAGAGYVLGTRAGRTRYQQIASQSSALLSSEPVQKLVTDAATAVKSKTPSAAHGLVDKAVAATGADPKATRPQGRTYASAQRPTDATAPSETGSPAGPALS